MITRRTALGMMAAAPVSLSPLPAFALDRKRDIDISLSADGSRCAIKGEHQLKIALAAQETVRVRFATIGGNVFAVKVSGLTVQIVGADGSTVEPVAVESFHIGGSETYDAIVSPKAASSFALSVDVVNDRAILDESLTTLRYTDLKSLFAQPVTAPSREVTTTLSSAMRDRVWLYSGQSYAEQKDALTLDEDEQVRITLHNDTANAQPISLGGLPFRVVADNSTRAIYKRALVLMPGEIISIDVNSPMIACVKMYSLTIERTQAARQVVVRPCYQHHPVLLS
jgi:FtsP/CotA-like multicopper oxidase with cupredoxin domain